MIDTVISSPSNKSSVGNMNPIILKLANWLPSKVNKRWPAIIFADNRIAKVNGRITVLILSIKTIKDINITGVPTGTKCANISLLFIK